MAEGNNNSRVAVRTSEAVTDLDGYPKTELYFNSYDAGKCYNWQEVEGEQQLVEVLSIAPGIVTEVVNL